MFTDADDVNATSVRAWRDRPAGHQPDWPDAGDLEATVAYLRTLPPLVFAGEADRLQREMAAASRGEAFVLMGGDCAESFEEATASHIRAKIRTILQMAVILTYGASVPVVKIGRMAGQYSKPRSAPTETRDGTTLPSYFGDAVNGHEFSRPSRTPDPRRLVEAYQRSAATLNLIRAFTTGGFADLDKVHEWNKGFMANPAYARYETVATEIDRAMRFMLAAGVNHESLRTVDLYASHEALILPYEEALTRVDSRTGQPYDCSAHFLWIGERTRDVDGAHVELLSRVRNPIGVKLGPSARPADVLALVDRLNPEGTPGRLTLIARMGASTVQERLPALVEAGARAGDTVVIGPEDSGVIFDWEPTMRTGAELLGPRGTDLRLDEGRRSSRKERKAAYHERMDAKADAREGLWMDRQAGLWGDPAEEG